MWFVFFIVFNLVVRTGFEPVWTFILGKVSLSSFHFATWLCWGWEVLCVVWYYQFRFHQSACLYSFLNGTTLVVRTGFEPMTLQPLYFSRPNGYEPWCFRDVINLFHITQYLTMLRMRSPLCCKATIVLSSFSQHLHSFLKGTTLVVRTGFEPVVSCTILGRCVGPSPPPD